MPQAGGAEMEAAQILLPMVGLAALTFVVLLLIAFARFRAAARGQVTARDFRYGESSNVPGEVSLPNRNLMNLLELPVLFYVVCLAFFVTGKVDALAVVLAWTYVALRAAHTVIHLTYNNVFHRLSAFAASNAVLLALWIRWTLALS
jgi:hypothetical protein